MSIQIQYQPQELMPVYNQMIIACTSSNQTQPNFQFVGDVYVNSVLVTRMKVPVNPDGYGVFDIHKHVENRITYDFDPEFYDWNVATNSFATYSVEFSEEYRPEWRFDDNYFAAGNVGFTSSTQPVGFTAGDVIFIAQDSGYTNNTYEGEATINSITLNGSIWEVVTNKPFANSSPANPGTMSLANYQLAIISVTASTGERYAWNGVENYLDFINYDYLDYTPGTASPGSWLTNMPLNWELGTQSRAKFLTYRTDYNDQTNLVIQSNTGTFRIASDSYSYGANKAIDTWQNNGGNLQVDTSVAHGFTGGEVIEINGSTQYDGIYTIISVESSLLFTVDTAYISAGIAGGETCREVTGGLLNENIARIVGVGPYELLTYTSSIVVSSGALPVIDSDTVTYSVHTENSNGDLDIAAKYFKIKDLCSRYEKIQLLFLDKLGSFIPYTFNRVNRHNKEINRTDYQQTYGTYPDSSNNWSYKSYDRGRKSLDIQVTNRYIVNSDWVDQTTSNYLMELFESPEIYWVKEDGTTVAINITTTGVERKQTINDQTVNYTLEFVLSQRDHVQRG